MEYKLNIPLLLMCILIHGAAGILPLPPPAASNLPANELRALFSESLAANTTATYTTNDTMLMPDVIDAQANNSGAIDAVINELLRNDTTGVVDASMVVGGIVSDMNSSGAAVTNASDTAVLDNMMSTGTKTSENATTLDDIVGLSGTSDNATTLDDIVGLSGTSDNATTLDDIVGLLGTSDNATTLDDIVALSGTSDNATTLIDTVALSETSENATTLLDIDALSGTSDNATTLIDIVALSGTSNNATTLPDIVGLSDISANASILLDPASMSETSVSGGNITDEVPSDKQISLGIDPNINQSSLSSITNETFQQNATTLVAEKVLLNATHVKTEATPTNVTVPITIGNVTSMELNVTKTVTPILPVVSLSSNDTIDTTNTSATTGIQLPVYLPQPPVVEIPITFNQDNQSTTVEIISPPIRNISSLTPVANGSSTVDKKNVSDTSVFPDTVLSFGGGNTSENATFEPHVVPSTKVSNGSDIFKDNLTDASLSTVNTTYITLTTVASSTSTAAVTPATKIPVTEPVALVFDHPPPIFRDGRRPPSYPDQLETPGGPARVNTRQLGFQKPTTTDLPPPPPIFFSKARSTPRYIVSHSTTTESSMWPAYRPPKTPAPENDPRYMTVAELTELALTNLGSIPSEQREGLQVFFNTIHPLTPEPVQTTTPMPSFKGPHVVFNPGTAAGPLNLPKATPIKEPPKQFFGADYLLNQIGIGGTATSINRPEVNVQKQQPRGQKRTGQSPSIDNVPSNQIQTQQEQRQQFQNQQLQNQLFQNEQLKNQQKQQHVNNQQFQNQQQQQQLNQQQFQNQQQQQPLNQQQFRNQQQSLNNPQQFQNQPQQPLNQQQQQPLNQQLFQNQQQQQPLNQQPFRNQQQSLNNPQFPKQQQQSLNNPQFLKQQQHVSNQQFQNQQQQPLNQQQFKNQLQQQQLNQQHFQTQQQQQTLNQQPSNQQKPFTQQKFQNQQQQSFNQQFQNQNQQQSQNEQQFQNQQKQLQNQIQQLQNQQQQLKNQQQHFQNQQDRLPNQQQQQQQFENQLRLFQQQHQQRQFQSQQKQPQLFQNQVPIVQQQQQQTPSSKQFFDSDFLLRQIAQESKDFTNQLSGTQGKPDHVSVQQQNKADWQKPTQRQWQQHTTLSPVDTYTPALTPQQQQRPFRTGAVTENPFTPFIKTGDLFLAQALEAWIKSMAIKPEILKQVRNDNMNRINDNLKAIQHAPGAQPRHTMEVIHDTNSSPSLLQTNVANDRNFRTSNFENAIRGSGFTLQRPRKHVYGILPTHAVETTTQAMQQQWQHLNNRADGPQVNGPFNPMIKPINPQAVLEQRQALNDRSDGHQMNRPFNHVVNPPMQTDIALSQAGGINNLNSPSVTQTFNSPNVGNQWPFSNRIGFGSVLPNPSGFSNFDLNLAATKHFNVQPSIITDTGVQTHIIPARTIPETESHWSSKANNSIKLPNVHVPYFMKTEASPGTTMYPTQRATMSPHFTNPMTYPPVRRIRFTTSTVPTVPPTVDPNPPAIFDTKVLQTFMPFPKPGDTTRPPKGEKPGGADSNTSMKGFDNRCTDCVFVNDRCLLPDTTHCSMFIECVRQGHMVRAFNRECALGAFFDRKSFLCVDPKNTDCPQDRCREPGLKWYPIHGHCKHYWSCASREGGGIYAQSECCPDMGGFVEGAGCVENPNCTESCDSVINTAPSTGCHLRKTAVPQIYFDTNANIERPCAPGTLFNEPKCTCEQDVTIERSKTRPGAGSCLPMLLLTFDNMTVGDTSHNRQHVGVEGVGTTQRGEGIFNGASRLVLWRYANLMFPVVFAVRFSFLGTTGGPRYQTVLSNCDPKSVRVPTFEISLDTVYHEVIFKVDTMKGTRKVFKQIYKHTKWTSVVLIYDGERIVGSVDTRARNIIAGGGIKTRPTPISVGACGSQDGLKGLLENLSIYEDCIPDDMYGIFISVLE